MDKQFTYGFLREEMQSIVMRQDTLLSIAYVAAISLWTIALTINRDWVAIVPIVLLIPFSLKTYDLRYGAIFLAVYIKVCLEEKSYDGWETIRDTYYEQDFGRPLKFANNLSKLSFSLLSIGSCIVFWFLRIGEVSKAFLNFQNGLLIVVQLVVVIFQIIMYYKFSTMNNLKKSLEINWTIVKENILI